MARTFKHVTRRRRLTAAEAEEYRKIREQIAQERPHLIQERRIRQAVAQLLGELRAARESRGLSLSDVERKTGMDPSALSKLERGTRDNPTLDTLVRYAEAVGKRVVISLVDSDT